MKILIIGSGFLWESIFESIKEYSNDILITHNENKKYPFSIKYNFFEDDIKNILYSRPVDMIFVCASIEYESHEKIKWRMVEFLESVKDKRIIYISSDAVYNGEKWNYKEAEIPNPVTQYWINLVLCEKLIQQYCKNYCIVRPSYMYGYVGWKLDSRITKIKNDTENWKNIIRFLDMFKSPLSYKQAAKIITEISFSKYKGIIHVCWDIKSVYDFTKESMLVLWLKIDNLIWEKIPRENKPVDFLVNTSLDNTLMKKLTNIKILNIKESLSNK